MTYDRYGYLIPDVLVQCVGCRKPVSEAEPYCQECNDWPADVSRHEEGGEA